MSKELRKSFLVGVILGLIFGWRMLATLFSAKPIWIKLIAVLVFIAIVVLWTWVYYRNYKFGRQLNQYVQKFNLTPEEVARVTGQGRYDFYFTTDQKNMVYYSSSEKLRKEVIARLAECYGTLDA